MQEPDKNSSRNLTLEQLLQLKRLEKPDSEFWAGFERDLQQKQLQALVRPSLWTRMRAAIPSTPAHFAPVSTAALVIAGALLAVSAFFSQEDTAIRVALQEEAVPVVESLVFAENAEAAGAGSAAEELSALPTARTELVVDAIVPDVSAGAAASFDTYYVVNAFPVDVAQPAGAGGGAMKF